MSKQILLLTIIIFIANLTLKGQSNREPIRLHPQNPHYFQYQGRPTVLITSAEHYGAVLNSDFDYETYLETLHQDNLNYTRIFVGSYVEIEGSFNIQHNTLAPATGKFLAPWKRVDQEGLYQGERKFDLSQWNPDYFDRLERFIQKADELGIIVEVTFFCSTYQDASWERNPFNPANNVNTLPQNLARKKSNTLDNGELTIFQKRLVEKIVSELNGYDNLFYEIQNEPWSDDPQKVMRILRTLEPNPGKGDWYKWAERASDASLEWQKAMAQVIVETENQLPKKHLIAQNYTNFKHSIAKVDPNISILNFHYVWPEAVWMNYAWNRPISFDESGFAGSSDTTYLRQAWQFMLAGGAVFNNLDYSFFVGKEDGTGVNNAPGGGSAAFRKQLSFLRSFLESFDFVEMKPDFTVVAHAPGLEWHAISEPGEQYAIIFSGISGEWIRLDLPKDNYFYEFVNPFDGKVLKKGRVSGKRRETVQLELPAFDGLVALKILN